MAALAYPETVLRAVKIIKAQLTTQINPEFPYRRVSAEFKRFGLSHHALAKLIELGMLEADPGANGKWYKPTGHAVWKAVG